MNFNKILLLFLVIGSIQTNCMNKRNIDLSNSINEFQDKEKQKNKKQCLNIDEKIEKAISEGNIKKCTDLLVRVVDSNCLERTKRLILSGLVNLEEKQGEEKGTIFIATCFMDNSPSCEIIQLLADNGANINAQDKLGKVALSYAISNEDFTKVEYLIEKIKVNPNIKNNEGNTPLMNSLFSEKNNECQDTFYTTPKIIELLIKNTNPLIKNNNDDTALEIALDSYETNNPSEIMKDLEIKKNIINSLINSMTKDTELQRVMHKAIELKDRALLKILINSIITKRDFDCLLFMKKGIFFENALLPEVIINIIMEYYLT